MRMTELRRALRWGSEHVGWYSTENEARQVAEQDIAANGNVGRIEAVVGSVVYYTVHEEEC